MIVRELKHQERNTQSKTNAVINYEQEMKEKATNIVICENGDSSELTMWRPRVSNLCVTFFCFWNYSSVFFHRIIIIFLLRLLFSP